jgi:outer membrane immunogenic protein
MAVRYSFELSDDERAQSVAQEIADKTGPEPIPISKRGTLMKTFVIGAAMFLAATAMVSAADMAVRAPRPAVVAPIEMYNWSGLYIGGQAGGAWLRAREDFVNDVGFVDPGLAFRASSFIGGGHAGAQAQWERWSSASKGVITSLVSTTVPSIVPGAPRVRSVDVHDIATIVGKLGYAAGPVLST